MSLMERYPEDKDPIDSVEEYLSLKLRCLGRYSANTCKTSSATLSKLAVLRESQTGSSSAVGFSERDRYDGGEDCEAEGDDESD